MKNSNVLRLILCCGMLLIAAAAFAQKNSTGQASVTLSGCSSADCYVNNANWFLGKCEGPNCVSQFPLTPVPNTSFSGGQGQTPAADGSSQTLNWNVRVQSVSLSATTLKVFGFLNVTNTGSAPAYLSNFVVNLQNKNGNKWPSVAADMLSVGQQANTTSVNICASADSNNASSFSLTSGRSGPLSLYDPTNNDLIAFNFNLTPGQSQVLLYEADFNIEGLGLNGQQLRVEAIVTFSNAGVRGGSGSVCTNPNHLDINNDGSYTADEYYYRSVPCRTTINVPAQPTTDNATVTLSDPTSPLNAPVFTADNLFSEPAGLTWVILDPNAVVNVSSASTTIGAGSGSQAISYPADGTLNTFGVTANASVSDVNANNAPAAGLDNCAKLTGTEDSFTLPDPTNPLGPGFTFTCNEATKLEACAWPLFTAVAPPTQGGGCTLSQGGWGSSPKWGAFLAANFATVYPNGVTVGGKYTMKFTSAQAVRNYLPAKKTPAALTQSLNNPTKSASGVFGGQVLTLQMSVDFGTHNIIGWTGISGLYYVGNTNSCEYGRTVSQILADANTLLGGGTISSLPANAPAACTLAQMNDIGTMNNLVDAINNNFDECNVKDARMFSATAPSRN